MHDARAAITDETTQTRDIVGHIQAIGGGMRRGTVAVVATDDRYLTIARSYAGLVNHKQAAEWRSSATLSMRRSGWTARLQTPSDRKGRIVGVRCPRRALSPSPLRRFVR